MVAQFLTVIQKLRLCSVEIEYFVDSWGWSIVGDFGNDLQAAAENMGRIF